MNRKQLFFGGLILSCLGLIGTNPAPAFAGQTDQEQTASPAAQEPASKFPALVIKTYTLKHIKPEELLTATRVLIENASFSDKMVTVKIWSPQIPKFEELLSKLDVEKKTIQFQVFAIVASRGRTEERTMQEVKERAPGVAQVSARPYSSPKMTSADQGKYTGEPITLKFKDANLRDVLAYLADFSRLNLVLDADVRGIVTCNLENIPWDQALDIVLSQNNMGQVTEGKIIRVAPLRILSRAQNPEKGEVIENKELKKVLDELKTLWNFKTYEVDGPSFLTVQEDSGPNNFKLVTNRQLNLVVSKAKVMGEEPGKRTITIEQLKLTGMANFVDYVFIDTHDVTLKERGYLVAGVSGYGSASNALILVINAEIK